MNHPNKSEITIMYTKTQSSTTSIVAGVVAAIGLLAATVVFGQSQDVGKTDPEQKQEMTQETQKSTPVEQQRDRPGRRQRLKTIDELPDGAQTLTLENGKELYFHDGQLYTYAASRSAYVQIPQALFTPRGLQTVRNGRRMKQAKMRHARQHHRHNQRFHRGRRRS